MKLRLQSGHAIDYPRSPKDVTLSQYIEYHNEVQPTMPREVAEYGVLVDQLNELNKELEKWYAKTDCSTPDELQKHLDGGNVKNNAKRFLPSMLTQWRELVERMEVIGITTVNDPLWLSKNWHPYQLRTVQCFFPEIKEDLTVDELNYLFGKCTAACLQPKEVDYKQLYYHDGVTYTLPDKLMRNSTLIEFAEAAQYESALKQATGGDANGLLKMCAVLLRPLEVTEYSEELFESNVKAFETLPLQVAYEVGFFFDMVKREIRTKFEPLYIGSSGSGNAKLDAVAEKYGFYTMIHNVAELGFFNLPNYTPLRSAELANLHEAYQLLTYRAELGAAKAEK